MDSGIPSCSANNFDVNACAAGLHGSGPSQFVLLLIASVGLIVLGVVRRWYRRRPHANRPLHATHLVPAQGLSAWAAPDATSVVAKTLLAGERIQVTRVWGAWAAVRGSDGWTGWADGRKLGIAKGVPHEAAVPREAQ